ncbi:hypothetical protein J2W17_004105 [Pseudomonas lini]|uniref:hypothetical protein n=1 Tax=Pseudomonas lini TaxID=163011 RepID=UPI00277FB1B8|nr:hypothetical protein [Pseudomonas lini]MDQ0125149.1 hypothetical protein [Pseudomonas lini]
MRLALAIGTPGKNRDDSSAGLEQRDAVAQRIGYGKLQASWMHVPYYISITTWKNLYSVTPTLNINEGFIPTTPIKLIQTLTAFIYECTSSPKHIELINITGRTITTLISPREQVEKA